MSSLSGSRNQLSGQHSVDPDTVLYVKHEEEKSRESLASALRLRGGRASEENLEGEKNLEAEDHEIIIGNDDSISEEDIRDVLLGAGYTMEAVSEIIATRTNTRHSLDNLGGSDPDTSGSESEGENALDILIAPPAVNRPFSVEKLRIFKNERSENALPTPHNPT